jgi:Protein of unknown function (DUF2958)
MARLRPWFLGHGSKRSRLDEGPSSSNQTVNSRCSEIDPNTAERSPSFPVASAQQRRSIPMELLPVELRKTLPPLYSQESCPTPIVHVKLFTPDSSFTWFVTEGAEQEDGDWLLFGLVIGFEEEWGYSLLSEIASARGPLGLPVERDLWFKPGPIDEVLRRERPSSTAARKGEV